MAETSAQQQYPNLNPYASTNGNGSLENAKNSAMNSKVSLLPSVCTREWATVCRDGA
jgi:hypothetical protein